MGDETANRMNLDLNLGPVEHPHDYLDLRSFPSGSITLEELIARQRTQPRSESSVEGLLVHGQVREGGLLVDGQVREGVSPQRRQCTSSRQRWRSMQRDLITVSPEIRNLSLELVPGSVSQICEANDTSRKKKEDNEKSDELSFFDCNICLDLAQEPVVTCCGHLYCWPCLYRWLNLHSYAKECPVCKGEVTMKTVTPIYGRGTPTPRVEAEGYPSATKIPQRPQAPRHEGWRQTIHRSAFTAVPVEEVIRRLGSRFDMAELRNHPNSEESPERRSSLLARILTSRGMRREQQNAVQTYSTGDDRDSMSSIAAMIQSEGQTVDTTVEIDSSRRRIADVDSGDSRPPRRRRLY
ncbi:unnamed protein product [Cuscuta europaea]|uniref:E3 ubiquitin-protein ligase RMA n=1 Tax=Cuscuta europaea TaxID=41803 RepID=A0A9P0ZEQ3_CUSEU|nr:unnamed protein product [Cuscuta europaea]